MVKESKGSNASIGRYIGGNKLLVFLLRIKNRLNKLQ